MSEILFPFAEYWWFYLGFTGFVLLMLALDLGVFHRHAHKVSIREAAIWSTIWVSLALAFNYGFYLYTHWVFSDNPALLPAGMAADAVSKQLALEFLTGFVVEKSLAIDNIFVFVVVFSYFRIPAVYQHRVLFFGIIGALIFRAIFIALGSVLMQYHTVVYLFGAFLIFTGIKMFWTGDENIEPEKNPLLRLLRRFIPLTPRFHGQHLFVKEAGKWFATPLFVALVVIEMSDIIFAVDSVPAIFALTNEPLIVYTSNIFAILGLRAMYFLLAGVIDRFYLLKYGLAVVLIFVGTKMVYLNDLFGGKFPISWSLGIIGGVIGLSVALSLLYPKKPPPIISGGSGS